MADKILADTSILIGLQKADSNIVVSFKKYHTNIQISRITANELIYGSRNRKEKKTNMNFIGKMPVVEMNQEISILSYKLIAKYGLNAKLGIADALIAATTISNKTPLWTLNKRHFRNIKEIDLINL